MCAFGVSLAPVAQPLLGPWATAVRAIAADHDITVVAGMFTPGTGGRVRNTLLATGRGVEASYDKIHLFDAYGFRESATVAPGTDPVTIDVDGVTIGLTTCYDVRFPGLYQTLADRGAGIILLAGVLGERAGQARAVGPADQGPGAGQHVASCWPRRRPTRRPWACRCGVRRRPGSAAAWRCHRPARCWPSSRTSRMCSWSTSTRRRPLTSAVRCRCWPIGASELMPGRAASRRVATKALRNAPD